MTARSIHECMAGPRRGRLALIVLALALAMWGATPAHGASHHWIYDDPESVETDRFRVWFTTEDGSVHETTEAWAQQILDSLEDAYAKLVAELGWSEPPRVDGGRFPAFVVGDLPGNTRGIAGADRIFIANEFTTDDEDLAWRQLKWTTAHEYKHSIQRVYRAQHAEPRWPAWVFEGQAEWAVPHVYPELMPSYTQGFPVIGDEIDPAVPATYGGPRSLHRASYRADRFYRWLERRTDVHMPHRQYEASQDETLGSKPATEALDAVLDKFDRSLSEEFMEFAAAASVWRWHDEFPDSGGHQTPYATAYADTDGSVTLDSLSFEIIDLPRDGDATEVTVQSPAGVVGGAALLAVHDPTGDAVVDSDMDFGLASGPAHLSLEGTSEASLLRLVVVNADHDYEPEYEGEWAEVVYTNDAITYTFDVTAVVDPDPPGTPQSVAATAGDQQVTVTWEAPVDDGGSPITSYTVGVFPGDDEHVVGGDAREAVIDGLENNHLYRFRVSATNAAGSGFASAWTQPVMPHDPDDDEAGAPHGPAGVHRLSGAERAATAAAISADRFNPGVPVAYLATSHQFADALSGGAPAAVNRGPVLLTGHGRLPSATAEELERLEPQRTVILGGEAAVSDAVRSEVAQLTGGQVDRLAGPNRFATAAQVSRDAFPSGVEAAFVATGHDYPDALAGGAAAAKAGGPILLTQHATLPAETRDELQRLQPERIYVLGGQGAVSDELVAQLAPFSQQPVQRLAGGNRYETATHIAGDQFETPRTVYVATGLNFADALAGVPAAGSESAPLVLVTSATVPSATRAALEGLAPERIVLLGGSAVISDAVEQELAGYLSP